ncbi:Uncharacterized protein BP5553_06480 [Venustampulla echinocandica]|uniref:Uncharacterized protein n=1 Tax=Venustampulla echinocandica TaxID=2656787 RepID=A0A370TK21_9HELO|nr:Uncharacterized protein BP5553_06480 [Venustampulla echinocandica]RDL35868.1 Uncharacterized protein BP5553_06480 [Venustampulla echinocandica]
MKLRSLRPGLLAILAAVAPVQGDDCKKGYTLCAPAGASSTTAPQIGSPEFQNLLTDLISSSLPPSSSNAKRASASLCCVSTLSCLTLANLAIPFCYDRFTTNFLLPDNSFGTVASGQYSSNNGDQANLLSGDYTLANGQKGNIYADNPSAKPNTATLALPSQFTASGVGSAIPATALGGLVTLTYTTTLPGTTIPGTTVSPTTISESIISTTTVLPQTISTKVADSLVVSTVLDSSTIISTAAPTTIQGTTRGASTIPGAVTTVTTTQLAPAATTSKKGGASMARGDAFNSLASLVIMIGLLLCYP